MYVPQGVELVLECTGPLTRGTLLCWDGFGDSKMIFMVTVSWKVPYLPLFFLGFGRRPVPFPFTLRGSARLNFSWGVHGAQVIAGEIKITGHRLVVQLGSLHSSKYTVLKTAPACTHSLHLQSVCCRHEQSHWQGDSSASSSAATASACPCHSGEDNGRGHCYLCSNNWCNLVPYSDGQAWDD